MHRCELLAIWIFVAASHAARLSNPFDSNDIFYEEQGEYDFIIVGSGPAGCVLANRLSENPNWKVLLLEAGEPETFMQRIPVMAHYFQSTKENWNYVAERSEGSCLGMVDQRCALPRGRALGGSSVINYMIYNRGHPRDYDDWAYKHGNEGWSYKEVLPYFKKSERADLGGLENTPFHSADGELSVQYPPYRSGLVQAFVRGAIESGYNATDYNSDQQIGVSFIQSTTLGGSRHSAASAFIDPIRSERPNLHILLKARVTKVLINPDTKEAYGVQYARNQRWYQATVSKEVILAAGAYNSPQLLMLSGVGPQAHLESVHVPVIHDLPGVGQNLYEHISYGGPTFTTNTTGESLHVPSLTPMDAIDYMFGRGVFTMPGGSEALVFGKAPNSSDAPDWPDYELLFLDLGLSVDEGTALIHGTRLTDQLYTEVFKELGDRGIDQWTPVVVCFRPKSRGHLELKDNNPFHWPLIYPNFFADPDDVEVILAGVKDVLRIARSPAMQAVGTRVHDVPLPTCRQLEFGSDDYWRCAIRTMSFPLHHPVNTCHMGPATNAMSVVDARLRVHGIKRLRVGDCSIIPQIISGHTSAAAYMIGEKLADMLNEDWS